MSAQVVPMSQPEEGWLYVLENPAMPNLCKVGMTTRSPEERAEELLTTGVPQPFRIAAAWPTADVKAAERAAHEALARWRTHDTREWFAVPAARAVAVLEAVLDVRSARRTPRTWRFVRGVVEGLGWLTLSALILAAFQS